MRVASVAVAYSEERLILSHLKHIPLPDERKLVLNSEKPWQGLSIPDHTQSLVVKNTDSLCIRYPWKNEEEQRNAGQEYWSDMDWIIVLDPDEFLTKAAWIDLLHFLETAEGDAYTCERQYTYYKDGVIDPPEQYKQIIAVRPSVRFIDKRVVNCRYGEAPVTLHHMSWRRTDEEVWNKITHYSHANEFDAERWYEDVWLADKRENVHPLTPSALREVIGVELPPEFKELGL